MHTMYTYANFGHAQLIEFKGHSWLSMITTAVRTMMENFHCDHFLSLVAFESILMYTPGLIESYSVHCVHVHTCTCVITKELTEILN